MRSHEQGWLVRVVLPFVLMAVSAAPWVWGQESCASYSPPPLFDSSGDPYSRALGVKIFEHNGVPVVLYNLGNELELREIADPVNPGPGVRSDFNVPPFGDRDYNLFGFDVCDGCRFGIAAFDAQGTVLFDVGTGGPSYSQFYYHPDAATLGGLTFLYGGDEYLIAKNLPGGCVGAPTLWRIWGLGETEREQLQCITAGDQAIGVDGGYRVSDASGDYVVIADQTLQGYIFKVDPGPVLAYTGTWVYAPTSTGHGLSVDVDSGLAASAIDTIRLYDISAGFGLPQLITEWEPDPGQYVRLVALHYPFLLALGHDHVYAYDISVPSAPVRIDVEFWDPSQPWNAVQGNRDAAFTADGRWLFLARGSVLQRFEMTELCLASLLFADDFESGDTGAWSAATP